MKKVLKKLTAVMLSLSILLTLVVAPTEVSAAEKSGTFTVASMNVDGLPQKILFVSLNSDGPGSSGTKAISQKLATYNWDIIGVSEDFNYHNELMSSMTNYSSGTNRGGVSGLKNDTDGLNLIWKNGVNVTGESCVSWNQNYSSGIFGTGNGADTMIDKGYRYYQAEVADGVLVDVYILHMDADSDAKDIAARESQLTQLANAIKASNNGNPIIVMGDTNSRYTRENLKTLFIDEINADSRFTIQDTWVEKVWNGTYPAYGSEAMLAADKGGTYDYPQAEIVDKIFYINNTDSDVTLTANSHRVATDFVDSNGTALADHWPVVVEFGYKAKTACQHNYQVTESVEATCEEAGSKTYTCTECGDSYTETIDALGHNKVVDKEVEATCTATGLTEGSHCDICNKILVAQKEVAMKDHIYVDGICTECGAEDPNYVPPCDHKYELTKTVEATCEEVGSKIYTCTECGDSYTETIDALGHNEVVDKAVEATCTATGLTEGSHCDICNKILVAQKEVAMKEHTYVDGICTECGAEDPNYIVPGANTLGSKVMELVDGKKYVFTYNDTYALQLGTGQSLAAASWTLKAGDQVPDDLIWTVNKTSNGYTISTEINGQKMYLYRTSSYTRYGYSLGLRSSSYEWNVTKDTSSNKLRIYSQSFFGRKYYVRYYNSSYGWISSTSTTGLNVYEVIE